MFSRKKQSLTTIEKLPRPRDIPAQIGYYMMTKEKVDPYLVIRLMAVLRQKPNMKDIFDFRLYDWKQVLNKDISIRDYESFEKYPEYVLYEGSWNKKNNEVYLKEQRRKVII